MNCRNNGSESLHRCKNHPNIRIQKVHVGGGRDTRDGEDGGGGINRYSLSLHSQHVWWAPPKEVKWIECKDLCKICESLPGIDETGECLL